MHIETQVINYLKIVRKFKTNLIQLSEGFCFVFFFFFLLKNQRLQSTKTFESKLKDTRQIKEQHHMLEKI